jgi:hypothetical protein
MMVRCCFLKDQEAAYHAVVLAPLESLHTEKQTHMAVWYDPKCI